MNSAFVGSDEQRGSFAYDKYSIHCVVPLHLELRDWYGVVGVEHLLPARYLVRSVPRDQSFHRRCPHTDMISLESTLACLIYRVLHQEYAKSNASLQKDDGLKICMKNQNNSGAGTKNAGSAFNFEIRNHSVRSTGIERDPEKTRQNGHEHFLHPYTETHSVHGPALFSSRPFVFNGQAKGN
ncbi:uncharacterized protein BDZ83DRAFT_727424 [Colletotrichum acutatum]|uniref:Uncharacterized protein n=1 Tax=Glomerella acutata TaxID=27357 RepID=A0AAD8XL97_GLOAC|nr:uncharacterized protein BDZ83DRAFT_727424 [Colletotrichum acutatum]KAK1729393.1 hypothetical protein BDZ83DRAFT_727424 [Colletotrichum acutatum]